MKKILIGIALIIVLVILYGFFINTKGYQLVEKNIEIENLPESFDGFKIIHISDILLGSTYNVNDLEKIVTDINQINPDIIVFTGDLISKGYVLNKDEIEKIKEQLKKMDATLYKYAILGDNDMLQKDIFEDIMLSSNFDVLDNESKYLFYKDVTPIKISGITDLNDVDNSLVVNNETLDYSFNLVLTHYPDYVENLKEKNVDVMLSGHSLKGQIKIPFLGGIIKKNGAYTYIDNYYEVDNVKLFVSGGLGTEKIQMRTFNKPEINLYRLKAI